MPCDGRSHRPHPAHSSPLLLCLLTLFLLLVACASLQSPVRELPGFVDGATPAAPAAPAAEQPLLTAATAVEGRPDGMLLRLTDRSAAAGSVLELHRREQEAGVPALRQEGPVFRLYHRVELDGRLAEALRGVGIDFLDRTVRSGHRYDYVLLVADAARADDGTRTAPRRSPVLAVQWQAPPPPPRGVRAEALGPGRVALSWRAPPGLGAVVLRRDVLHPERGWDRAGELGRDAGGLFVDEGLAAGGVYAYRIALLRRGPSSLAFFGQPSDAFYVSLPAS